MCDSVKWLKSRREARTLTSLLLLHDLDDTIGRRKEQVSNGWTTESLKSLTTYPYFYRKRELSKMTIWENCYNG